MSEERKSCPACGEPVEPGWKICPSCEVALSAPTCPGCGRKVKENWRRCPECEVRLRCGSCGRRLAAADGRCTDCSAPAAVPVFLEPATGITFHHVAGGEFLMGDTFGEGIANEQPVHSVWLADYYISACCITQSRWDRFMSQNPSRFPGQHNPVENVNLSEVKAFIEKIRTASGGRRFSLPTEAQWEYAARSGGREQRYAGGDNIDAVAWYADNSDGRPHPVAGRRPNALGLYDMSGNVWEWCRDSFRSDAYEVHAQKEPVIEDDDNPERVIRGGSWNLDAWSARCARRFSFRAVDRGPGLGFRLVLTDRSSDGP